MSPVDTSFAKRQSLRERTSSSSRPPWISPHVPEDTSKSAEVETLPLPVPPGRRWGLWIGGALLVFACAGGCAGFAAVSGLAGTWLAWVG